jgi:hypothetical protein
VSGTSQAFDSEVGYRTAIALTLAGATRELQIFDRDLASMDLEARGQIDLLTTFLAAGRNRHLRVVLHDLAPLQTHMPRLLALMRDNAGQVEVRITPEHLHRLTDAWVLADETSGAIRFHADHARGKCIVAMAPEIAPWWQRANDLWDESTPCSPWTVTGL